MSFFKNSTNFAIGQAHNHSGSGDVTFNINNHGSEHLLPPNLRAGTRIETQVNGPQSAPIMASSPSVASESSPPIATSQSMPEVPSAQLETLPAQSVGHSSVEAEPKDDPPASPVYPSGPSSMPSPPPSPRIPAPPTPSPRIPAPPTPAPRSPALPTPSPRTPAPPTPRVESAQPRNEAPIPANTSRSNPPSQHRPRPDLKPLQLGTTSTEIELTNQSAPTFRYGIVAAFSAQAHLLQRTKPIGDLLDRYGIRSDSWVGQVGFRLDNSSHGPGAELPSILRQEIVITISDRGSAKAGLSEISEGLKALITPYYGAIKFQNSKEILDLESQATKGSETSTSKNLFVKECSRAHESPFEVDLPDSFEAEKPPIVKLNVTNFADDENPQNHFTTSLKFTLEKDEKSRQGSDPSKIDFSELHFEGPVPYSMRGAYVRVTLNQPSNFEDVIPEGQSEVDATSQYKHSAQKTKKKQKTQEAQLKIGKATEGTIKAGRMTGEDSMDGVETMRNSWLIRHSEDRQSKTLRYFSARPELARQMSFPKAFRPSMKFTANSKRSPPSTITVRIWSFWALESQAGQREGGLLKKVWTGFRSVSAGKKPDPRMHTNVVHCVEVVVPLAFVGSASEFATQEDILEELV